MNKAFTMKFPDDLYSKVNDEAHRRGISMAELVRKAVDAYLRKAGAK